MEARRQLSVIVPTYNEVDNVKPLCERLFAAGKKHNLEIDLLLMDDESVGSDATKEIVDNLARTYAIRIHCRKKSEGKGLSSAVLLGLFKAKYEVMLVMDADLQHEPEAAPLVAAPVLERKADFSVGSRNVEGGGIGGDWPLHRRLLSKGATLLALGVAPCSDPMSGFFCLDKDTLARAHEGQLNTMGFKIGLELMVKCKCTNVKEVPITFQDRVAGESKLTMKQNIEYLVHLVQLYWYKYGVLLLVLVLALLVALYWLVQTFLF